MAPRPAACRTRRALLGACAGLLLSGCGQGLPTTVESNGVAWTLAVTAVESGYGAQVIAHRWVAADIHHYEVTLRRWDGTRYADLTPQVSVLLPQKGSVKREARFSNLRQGARYQATIRALGNVGGTAPDVHLNTQTPATTVFDLSVAQGVPDTLSSSLNVILDPVPFSGTVTVSPQNVPPQASTFDLELRDVATGAVRYASSYSKNKTMVLDNLRTGIRYVVRLTAKRGNGSVVGTAQSAEVFFDPAGQDLEQSLVVPVSF